MIELRTPAEIEQMRPAGRFVADVLTQVGAAAKVGVNLLELDAMAHEMIKDRGAESCYIDYHPSFGASPFGKVICTSVNDAVLHGLPFDYRLQDGDLLSLDFAASVDGWVSDSAVSFVVGNPRAGDRGAADQKLIVATQEALAAGIAAAQPGNKVGDISAAIAAEMSPILLPGCAAAMPAASASWVASMSFWSATPRSPARGFPTTNDTALSETQPSTEAAKSRLSRSPSWRR